MKELSIFIFLNLMIPSGIYTLPLSLYLPCHPCHSYFCFALRFNWNFDLSQPYIVSLYLTDILIAYDLLVLPVCYTAVS